MSEVVVFPNTRYTQIDFRREWLITIVREKSDWQQPRPNISRGVSAYYCHNSYVAEVVDLRLDGNNAVIESVYVAVDCGIVVNPDSAKNMGEGGIIDGSATGKRFYDQPFANQIETSPARM